MDEKRMVRLNVVRSRAQTIGEAKTHDSVAIDYEGPPIDGVALESLVQGAWWGAEPSSDEYPQRWLEED